MSHEDNLKWTDQAHSALQSIRDQVDYAEIRAEFRKVRQFSLNEAGVQRLNQSESSGGCTRILRNGNFGFASFANPEKMSAMLLEARASAEDSGAGTASLAPIPAYQEEILHHFAVDPFEIAPRDVVATLDSYRQTLMTLGQGQIRSVRISLNQELDTRRILHTGGTDILQQTAHCQLVLMVQGLTEDQKPIMMVDILGSTTHGDFYLGIEERLRILVEKFHRIRPAKPVQSGKYTVVLDPLLAGVFAHESFGHTSEADMFAMKPGGLDTLKLGRRFGPKELSIFDTPFIPGYPGAMKYDDEGVLCQQAPLLVNGILEGRMHSRETAAKLKEAPTGNARAMNSGFAPIVRMRNTCIAPGNSTLEELLDGIEEGVYCAGCYGGTGGEDFTFSASHGYMIRNGKIEEPVREITIRGNLFETLEHVEGIGKPDLNQSMFGSCGKEAQFPLAVGMTSPHIRVRDMMIGGGQ